MTDLENQLIEKFKQDMSLQCGKMVEVKILDKWDELCYFDREVPLWTLIKMILDATGWDPHKMLQKRRLEEIVSQRRIVDLIAISNGKKLTEVGRAVANRDHTTVISSVRAAKEMIEKDPIYRTYTREIMQYIRENYHLYREKDYDRDNVLNNYN